MNLETFCAADGTSDSAIAQAALTQYLDRTGDVPVGEVRDGSALGLLKAWNTGHPGGMATIHANDSSAMLDRIAAPDDSSC